MASNKSSRIQTNLLQQNIFVRDCVRLDDLKSSVEPSNFISLDEVVTDKGVEIKETVQPYHITPDYVDSFVDSSDYRNDLSGAVMQSLRKGSSGNLGDVRDIQNIMNMPLSDARAMYDALSKRLSRPQSQPQSLPQPQSQPQSQSIVGGDK